MRWRMERASRHEEMYGGLARFGRERADFVDDIYRQIVDRGPIAASDIEGAKGSGGWWGWCAEKQAFEWLFWAGKHHDRLAARLRAAL